MAAPADQAQPAGDAAPPPRTPTFLARYPRKLKLGIVIGLFAFIFLLWFFHTGGSDDQSDDNKVSNKVAAVVSGADSRAAVANPAPAPIPGTMGVIKKDDRAANEKNSVATSGEEEGNKIIMAPAPDPGLTEDTAQGSLPRIGEDGRQPWQVYARPFDTSDKRPRIAIVITDLGLERVDTDAAIAKMPPNVTLAFDAQSPVASAWSARARAAGHETLLTLPMEPFDYPRSDPGPNTWLSNIPIAENIQRLRHSLMQANGYVGVTTLSGTRFSTDPTQITPVLEEMKKRGLLVFDARVAPHSAFADMARDARVPVVVDTQRIDQNLSPTAIDESLNQLEQTARLTGRAVAMAPPLPVIMDTLREWIKGLPKDGIALAPLTAMVQ
jgi:uncharacterized protein